MQLEGDWHPVAEINHEMVENRAPITDGHRPFFSDVDRRQIQNFHQSVIGNKGALRLCHLAQLAIEILNSIGRVNERANFRRILEHSRKLRPVYPPALDSESISAPGRTAARLVWLSTFNQSFNEKGRDMNGGLRYSI